MIATSICASLLGAGMTLPGPLLQSPRFELVAPIPTVPPVPMDMLQYRAGIASHVARSMNLQARILWIDCTANLDRYNTVEKIETLVAQIKRSGFNTIVFDIKPISGQVNYPSKYAPKLTEWRGRTLPVEFDPVRYMTAEARKAGLPIYLAMNAFSEGHRMFKVGPGYEKKEWQTVLYEPHPHLVVGKSEFPVSLQKNTSVQGEAHLSVFNDPKISVKIPDEGFAISIDRMGRVVDGFLGGQTGRAPTIPTGGSVVVGQGKAATFLKSASPGDRVRFSSKPLFVPISERPEQQIPLMVNPLNPDVVQRNADMIAELIQNYQFDGLIYDDRLRFANANADFSAGTRAAFERSLGRNIRWPEDVFVHHFTPGFSQGVTPGRYYQQWLEFRAKLMQQYVQKVSSLVKKARLEFGVYAGSWFGEYAGFGTNYSSPSLSAGFWYLSAEYAKAGFADKLDFLITGCYYPTPTIFEAMQSGSDIGRTIESGGYLTNSVVQDRTWCYAGIMLSDFKGDPDRLQRALQAACGATQGVMVFDLSHEIEPFWPVFAQTFRVPMVAPNKVLAARKTLERHRLAWERSGKPRRPVIIAPGAPGAGH